jgi:hypothetical protein
MNWTTNRTRKRDQCSFIVREDTKGRLSQSMDLALTPEAEAEELVQTLPSAAALPDGAADGGLRQGLRRGVLARCLLPEKEAPAPVEADPLIGLERCTRHQSKISEQVDLAQETYKNPRNGSDRKRKQTTRTIGSAVGGVDEEAGGVGAEQRHAALAGVAAERGADEPGDGVALVDEEPQRPGATEHGHRHQHARAAAGPEPRGGLAAGLRLPQLHRERRRHRDGHRWWSQRESITRLPINQPNQNCRLLRRRRRRNRGGETCDREKIFSCGGRGTKERADHA